MEIQNLVFEGGGVKGSAYAGAMDALATAGFYASVEQVAGASAGSITASLLATGSGATGLMQAVNNTDFGEFIFDHGGLVGDVSRLLRHYGLHTGDRFVEILRTQIQQFCGNPDLTFRDLDALHEESPEQFKRLSVVASNLNRQCAQVFNAASHPDLPIWRAVRCSISIPVIFEPYAIDGELFVDGGLSWNYPIDIFDVNNTRDPATVGFYLEDHKDAQRGATFDEQVAAITDMSEFVESLASFMYETANKAHIHPKDKSRTVFIDDLSISGADFHTPKDRLAKLIQAGRTATEAFIEVNTRA